MNIESFKLKHKLSNADLISALKPHYPNFSKMVASIICHPEKYGVTLSPKAARILREEYEPPKEVKPKVKKKCPCCGAEIDNI